MRVCSDPDRIVTPSQGSTVCQLVHGLPIGGAEVLISRIVQCLGQRYKFVVACLDEVGQLGEMLAAQGIQVVHLRRRPGFDWRCVHNLSRLCREASIQLIHAHQCTPFAYALATRLIGRRPPILLTEHGRFYPDHPSFKRKCFHRLLTGANDRFVAVGRSVRQALIDNEGLPQARLEVVYNGVDVVYSPGNHCDRQTARAELGVSDHECMVLQVARLDPIKDHRTAIRAIALAANRDPRIRLFIVGDGPERSSIEQQISRQSLHGRVVLVGCRSDVPRLLAAADVFLLTSVSEGIPVTIIEAMAAGTPVVATAVGGVPELISDGVTGLLAPQEDEVAVANALVRMAGDCELRRRLAGQAKHRAETEFSEQRMTANYDCIYQEMLLRTTQQHDVRTAGGPRHHAVKPGRPTREPTDSSIGCVSHNVVDWNHVNAAEPF
jgi:sugar transferase (PEP-CTERM/EpsH1 system associated)